MDSIEQAIRNALAKGDAEDPAFRERVYRSAQAALERAVLANQSLPADAVARRRRLLFDAVGRVEADHRIAVAPEVAPAPPPYVDPPRQQRMDAPPPAPSIEIGETRGGAPRPAGRAGRQEPAFEDDDTDDQRAAAPPVSRRTRERDEPEPYPMKVRRPFPWGTVTGLTTLLVVAGLGYWTAIELDLVRMIDQAVTREQPKQTDSGSTEAPASPGNKNPLADWMPVFSPSDPTTVAAEPGARAEVVTDDGRQVMRISSGNGGAALRFDIGAGVLERLAGKRAVFDIVAVASGDATQMSVTCALGKLENCGRNRYTVGVEQSEYLFEVDVPKGAGKAAGAIEIVADVTDGGKSVDIVEIRVSTAEAARQ